jgi:hypothetical protein
MEPDVVSKVHDEALELFFFFAKNCQTGIALCAGALSWWRIQPFFHSSGLFL